MDEKDRKIVITYGTFDMLHIGHLNLLRRAKVAKIFKEKK